MNTYRKSTISLLLLLSTCLIAIVPNVQALTTSTIYSTGDTYFTGDGHKNDNHGSDSYIRLKHPSAGFSHIVLRFSQSDIATAIGSATLVSAKLKLFIETNNNNWGNGTNVDVHRLTQDWGEMQATWNCAFDTNTANSNQDCATSWNGGTYSTPQTASIWQTNNLTGWVEFDVTSDIQAFLSGIANYGWLVRKRSTSAQGMLDFTSREGNANQTPRLELTLNTPPTCTATPSPHPNQYEWNNTDVTVTCSCLDSDGCTSSGGGAVTQEGAARVVWCHAEDSLGATSDCSQTINLDKTPPSLEVTWPQDGTKLGIADVLSEGTSSDSLSSVQRVECNQQTATLNGNAFNCTVQFEDGPNQLQVVAADFAGNSATVNVPVTVLSGSCSQLQGTSVSPETISLSTPTTVTVSGAGLDAVSAVVLDGFEFSFTIQSSHALSFDVDFPNDGTHQVLLYSICSSNPFYVSYLTSGTGGTQPQPLIIRRVGADNGVLSQKQPFVLVDSSIEILPTNEMLSDPVLEFVVGWTATGTPTIDTNHPSFTFGRILGRLEKPYKMATLRGPDGQGVNYILIELGSYYSGMTSEGTPVPNDRYNLLAQASLLRHEMHGPEGVECELGYDDAEEIATALGSGATLATMLDANSLNTMTAPESELSADHCLEGVNCELPFVFQNESWETDDHGYRHSQYQQYYEGIPVLGGYVEVETDTISGQYEIDDETKPEAVVSTTPAFDSSQAINLAQSDLLPDNAFIGQAAGSLVISTDEAGNYALAYFVGTSGGRSPLSGFTYEIVDAITGQTLDRFVDPEAFGAEPQPEPLQAEDCPGDNNNDQVPGGGILSRAKNVLRYNSAPSELLGFSDYYVGTKKDFDMPRYFRDVNPFVNLQRLWVFGNSAIGCIKNDPCICPITENHLPIKKRAKKFRFDPLEIDEATSDKT